MGFIVNGAEFQEVFNHMYFIHFFVLVSEFNIILNSFECITEL